MRARLWAAALVVAAVAVGHVITTSLPLSGGVLDPFVRTGAVDEPVALSYADVRLTEVRPAQYLGSGDPDDLAVRAGGVWVVAEVRVSATREPTVLRSAWLESADGRRYRASVRSGCTITLEAQTGVPAYAQYCFDVPAGALEGLRFSLARAVIGDPGDEAVNGDDLARIDLGVDAGRAAEWRSTTAAYVARPWSWEPLGFDELTLTQAPS